MAEEPAPPYHLVSTEKVGIQGFAPSSSDNAVAEVWQLKVSIKEIILAILALPYTPLQ